MNTAIDKSQILKQLVAQLEKDLATSQAAAEAARDAATNEESRSEDKHDTRSIEAGYLAGAQRKRVAEIKELINAFKILKPKNFSRSEPISATAIIELEYEGESFFYFFLPQGGGLTTSVDGLKIQTVTPQTPLGETLLGLKEGDVAVVEAKATVREYDIISVR